MFLGQNGGEAPITLLVLENFSLGSGALAWPFCGQDLE